MTITTTNFTTREKRRIKPLLKSLVRFLPWWMNDMEVIKVPGDDGMGCSPSKKYRRLVIEVYEGSMLFDDGKLTEFFCHEMAHCYNEPMLDIIELIQLYIPDEASQEAARVNVIRVVEQQTEDLAIKFMEMM